MSIPVVYACDDIPGYTQPHCKCSRHLYNDHNVTHADGADDVGAGSDNYVHNDDHVSADSHIYNDDRVRTVDVDTCSASAPSVTCVERIPVWYSSTYKHGVYRVCVVIPSTTTMFTHVGRYPSEYLAALICTDRVIELCGYYITLYTDSSYVANVFNDWVHRWMCNNYMTMRNGKVRYHSTIRDMVHKGCMKVSYVDSNVNKVNMPDVGTTSEWRVLTLYHT